MEKSFYHIRTSLLTSHIQHDFFNLQCLLNYWCNESFFGLFCCSKYQCSTKRRTSQCTQVLHRASLCLSLHCHFPLCSSKLRITGTQQILFALSWICTWNFKSCIYSVCRLYCDKIPQLCWILYNYSILQCYFCWADRYYEKTHCCYNRTLLRQRRSKMLSGNNKVIFKSIKYFEINIWQQIICFFSKQ